MYSEQVYEHFAKPRNVGVIENADGYARVESPVHHDLIDLYIRVEGDRIVDIKYRVQGCVAAIASSSITSELAKGQTLDAAAAFTPQEIADALHGLPENKVQCSVLAPEALRQAIQKYRERIARQNVSVHE